MQKVFEMLGIQSTSGKILLLIICFIAIILLVGLCIFLKDIKIEPKVTVVLSHPRNPNTDPDDYYEQDYEYDDGSIEYESEEEHESSTKMLKSSTTTTTTKRPTTTKSLITESPKKDKTKKQYKFKEVNCGKTFNFSPIKEKDYERMPWIVRLVHSNATHNGIYCSGYLLAADQFVTSENCLKDVYQMKFTSVQLGGTKKENFDDAIEYTYTGLKIGTKNIEYMSLNPPLQASKLVHKICKNIFL